MPREKSKRAQLGVSLPVISWDPNRTLQTVESDPGAFTPARQDRHRDDHRSNATLLYCGNRVRQKRSRPTDGVVDVICMLKHTSGAYTRRVPKHQGRVDQVCLGVWASMKAKASGRLDVYTQGKQGSDCCDNARKSARKGAILYCTDDESHFGVDGGAACASCVSRGVARE